MQITPSFIATNQLTWVKKTAVAALAGLLVSVPAVADINESDVQQYAASMRQAANQKSINDVAKLVADDALISISRKGKTANLNKSAYLKLLQDSWSKNSNYRYAISIDNIVLSGNQAKANINTIETWQKNGADTTLTTNSRATLKNTDGNALLLRSVSQVSID